MKKKSNNMIWIIAIIFLAIFLFLGIYKTSSSDTDDLNKSENKNTDTVLVEDTTKPTTPLAPTELEPPSTTPSKDTVDFDLETFEQSLDIKEITVRNKESLSVIFKKNKFSFTDFNKMVAVQGPTKPLDKIRPNQKLYIGLTAKKRVATLRLPNGDIFYLDPTGTKYIYKKHDE